MNVFIPLGVVFVAATGCASLDHEAAPSTTRYTEAAQSGLIAVRPYPTANDVCEVIGENSLTNEFLDDSAILIGCPKHERGAIAARLGEGGQIVAHARHWTLISVPQR
jgi:hypothetical protein